MPFLYSEVYDIIKFQILTYPIANMNLRTLFCIAFKEEHFANL